MNITYKITPFGLFVPKYITRKKERPTAFSFFAGAGGMDLGFIQAGFEVVGANEFDPIASLTYMVNLGSYPMKIHYIDGMKDKERLNEVCERYVFRKNKPNQKLEYSDDEKLYNNALGSGFSGSGWIKHNPDAAPVRNFWFGNIRKLKGKDILDELGMKPGELDCVMGGPPCQGFSQAGKQNIADPRNNLVYEFGRMIVELQPKTFVMEEVPAILNFFDPDGVPVLDKFAMMISEGGYGKWEHIKKGMIMQACSAAGMKSINGIRGDLRVSNKATKKKKDKDESVKLEQISFLDVPG